MRSPISINYTRFKQYLALIRFNKPIGTLLLLWPTLWALWIASKGTPNILILFIFAAGTFLMRSAGCAINDFADQSFDRHVDRTKSRPLASDAISSKEAVFIFVILSLCAFGLVVFLNTLTILLSIVALGLACLYPFMKRYTHWPQLVLGFAFSMGIPMAFAAVQNHIPFIAWILYLTNIIWTISYDTSYAMTDRKDDLIVGVKSTAILFGKYDILIITLLQICFISLLLFIGWQEYFSVHYFLSVAVASLLFVYQQRLIRHRKPTQCFKAFLNNHWVGFVVFIGIAMNYC